MTSETVSFEQVRATAEARFITAATGIPPRDDQKAAVRRLQGAAIDFATEIELLVKDGCDKSLALTHLEDVLMRANRGVFA